MSSLGKGPWTTKLSSAGLVYAFYGQEAISNLTKKTDQSLIDKVYAKVIQNCYFDINIFTILTVQNM